MKKILFLVFIIYTSTFALFNEYREPTMDEIRECNKILKENVVNVSYADSFDSTKKKEMYEVLKWAEKAEDACWYSVNKKKLRKMKIFLKERIVAAEDIDTKTSNSKSISNSHKNVNYNTKIHNNIALNSSYQMAGITYIEYIIKGNSEQCSITYDEYNNMKNTTCKSLTNSKGINILCTKKKEICKTEREIIALFDKNHKMQNITEQKNTFVTAKGTEFISRTNKHGAVLQSKSFTIYLGKDCDVTSPQFGKGSWLRDKGGFYLTFKSGKIISFPNRRAPTGECWWINTH